MLKLTPEVYGAAIDEAHKHNLRTLAHVYTLEDAKGLLRAGIDGFAHNPWREQEADTELVALLQDRPNVIVLTTLWASRNQIYGARPAWLDEPLLHETFAPEVIEALVNPDTPADAPETWAAGGTPRSVAKTQSGRRAFRSGRRRGGH